MPSRPPRLCPKCRGRVPAGQACTTCRRSADAARPSGSARGWSLEWAAFRRDYLERNPRCVGPRHGDLPMWARPPATDLDHLDGHSRTCAHRFDERIIEGLCHSCHSAKTVAVDGGFGRAQTAVPRCLQ